MSGDGVPNGKWCWYRVTTFACPICGREKVYRERQLPPAPPKVERYTYTEVYDQCDEYYSAGPWGKT